MQLEEFRKRVREEFGEDLHRASPASVRDFLDRLQMDVPEHGANAPHDRRIELTESARSYEEVMRTFFARVLDLPQSDAVMLLWAVAFDLAYASIENLDADRIGHLFSGLEEPAP